MSMNERESQVPESMVQPPLFAQEIDEPSQPEVQERRIVEMDLATFLVLLRELGKRHRGDSEADKEMRNKIQSTDADITYYIDQNLAITCLFDFTNTDWLVKVARKVIGFPEHERHLRKRGNKSQ